MTLPHPGNHPPLLARSHQNTAKRLICNRDARDITVALSSVHGRFAWPYYWPGNLRQLINALERAKILCENETVSVKDLPKEVIHRKADPSESNDVLTTDDLAALQRSKVVEVLRREAGNKSRAARALGIDRRKLYRLLEKNAIADAELPESTQ